MGWLAEAGGDLSVAIGFNSLADQGNTIAVGAFAEATGADAIAIGGNTTASGVSAIALGDDADATGEVSIAIGVLSNASGQESVALGSGGEALGIGSTALGSQSSANANGATAVGWLSSAMALNATALGANSHANGSGSTSIGWLSERGRYEFDGDWIWFVRGVGRLHRDRLERLWRSGTFGAICDRQRVDRKRSFISRVGIWIGRRPGQYGFGRCGRQRTPHRQCCRCSRRDRRRESGPDAGG